MILLIHYTKKKKIEIRGRPKRATTQLSFNKTSVDRKRKNASDGELDAKRRNSALTRDSEDDDDNTELTCLNRNARIARKLIMTHTKCGPSLSIP